MSDSSFAAARVPSVRAPAAASVARTRICRAGAVVSGAPVALVVGLGDGTADVRLVDPGEIDPGEIDPGGVSPGEVSPGEVEPPPSDEDTAAPRADPADPTANPAANPAADRAADRAAGTPPLPSGAGVRPAGEHRRTWPTGGEYGAAAATAGSCGRERAGRRHRVTVPGRHGDRFALRDDSRDRFDARARPVRGHDPYVDRATCTRPIPLFPAVTGSGG
jgi:hypothetical protein